MHVEEKVSGEVAILSLRGELVDDEGDSVLNQKVNSLTVDGITKFIIDLGKVNRINSRGLGVLISAVKRIRAAGGDMRLAQIDKNLNEIFMETKLVQIFNTYETVGRAVASFSN